MTDRIKTCSFCEYNEGRPGRPRCTDDEIWVDDITRDPSCRYRNNVVRLGDYLEEPLGED